MAATDRRGTRRSDAALSMRVHHNERGTITGTTRNVGLRDILFCTKIPLPLRETYQIEVCLRKDDWICCHAVVIRTEPAPLGKCAYAARILNFSPGCEDRFAERLDEMTFRNVPAGSAAAEPVASR